MTGINCDLFTHKSSRSYLNHIVLYTKHHYTGYNYATGSTSEISVVKARNLLCSSRPDDSGRFLASTTLSSNVDFTAYL
jgi:hypothetical protein